MKDTQFIIGIDSDGTMYDSMTIKHTDSFIPAMISVFGMDEYRLVATEIEENVNLYSKTRGVNRFLGLYMTFEKLVDIGYFHYDIKPLYDFINSGAPLSNDELDKYIQTHSSEILEKTLEWSIASDKLFSKNSSVLEPFKNGRDFLESEYKKAHIAVVSSASFDGIIDDWGRSDILKYTDTIMGRENGSKSEQLLMISQNQKKKENILMIGDAISDLKSAQDVGALFFPIIAGDEENSWKYLKEDAIERFYNNSYKGDYQDKLIDEFYMSFERHN